MGSEKRLYVIDTNVLMHDPTALYRFEEHDIFLPMMVLEELDAAKKGLSEVARNVRQVSRFIGEMMERQEVTHLEQGLDQGQWQTFFPNQYAGGPFQSSARRFFR